MPEGTSRYCATEGPAREYVWQKKTNDLVRLFRRSPRDNEADKFLAFNRDEDQSVSKLLYRQGKGIASVKRQAHRTAGIWEADCKFRYDAGDGQK